MRFYNWNKMRPSVSWPIGIHAEQSSIFSATYYFMAVEVSRRR